jgi:Rieske Fe-S protein
MAGEFEGSRHLSIERIEMKRRNFLAVTVGLLAQIPLTAIAATKKPTPKATAKATAKATPKTTAKATPKATTQASPTPAAATQTPSARPTPSPQLMPVLRDGALIKIASINAPTSFYASVEKNGIEYPLLISKPTDRTIKIFTARCPHQGNVLNLAALGEFSCDRHGARFSEATGKVLDGPTAQNLMQYELIERDGSIYITF